MTEDWQKDFRIGDRIQRNDGADPGSWGGVVTSLNPLLVRFAHHRVDQHIFSRHLYEVMKPEVGDHLWVVSNQVTLFRGRVQHISPTTTPRMFISDGERNSVYRIFDRSQRPERSWTWFHPDNLPTHEELRALAGLTPDVPDDNPNGNRFKAGDRVRYTLGDGTLLNGQTYTVTARHNNRLSGPGTGQPYRGHPGIELEGQRGWYRESSFELVEGVTPEQECDELAVFKEKVADMALRWQTSQGGAICDDLWDKWLGPELGITKPKPKRWRVVVEGDFEHGRALRLLQRVRDWSGGVRAHIEEVES
jgi:hypothetical protein